MNERKFKDYWITNYDWNLKIWGSQQDQFVPGKKSSHTFHGDTLFTLSSCSQVVFIIYICRNLKFSTICILRFKNDPMSSHNRRSSVYDALSSLLTIIPNSCTEESGKSAHMSSVPSFELFASKIPASRVSNIKYGYYIMFYLTIRSYSALEKFEKDVRIDDILVVKVKKFDVVGAFVKPMCFAMRLKRDLEWLEMQVLKF
uniref:Retrovirus-related Pol polyprotein from transposon TNT 1-94 n=1 Tax=Heterorhabditis bacteriophora TaxID=37862 RepID=A0A1I7WIX7_HETBA